MSLFFKDTIFLKDDCDLEKDIKELESLSERVTDKQKLQQQINFLRAGLAGEKAIEYELKNADIGMYVLHDVNIHCEDLYAQIDYIIITAAKIYLVECKNMIGDISVDNKGQFVRKLPWGKKEAVYSPITQAQRHIDILKKCRSSKRSAIVNTLLTLLSAKSESIYHPLVVIANSNGILDMKYASKDIKSLIVRVDGLLDYLRQDIKNAKIESLLSKSEMEDAAKYILSLSEPREEGNWSDRFTLLENKERKSIDAELKSKLIEYRKQESTKRNYPAYYIFTNDQLDKLISIEPKSVEELKNILEPIKIKMYGEEIIDIIKQHQ